MSFTVNSFLPYLRLTVKIFQFLRLSTKFLAVLRLSVNPFETLIKGMSPGSAILSPTQITSQITSFFFVQTYFFFPFPPSAVPGARLPSEHFLWPLLKRKVLHWGWISVCGCFNFLQSSSLIWITESDFRLSVNAMVSYKEFCHAGPS